MPSPGDFTDVDSDAEPAACVAYLDMAARVAADYKAQILTMVDPCPGERLLDVGCGTGDDARLLAERVTPDGHVIGIDQSRVMVEEARRRAEGKMLSVDYQLGDAHHLDFTDQSFDGCRAERILQHLTEPRIALLEMARVVRLGGRMVVSEPDWDSAVIDATDRRITRALINFKSDRLIRHGWIGRQLPGLFQQAGLEEIVVQPATICVTDLDTAAQGFGFEEAAHEAEANGVLSHKEVELWFADLKERAASKRFFASLTCFIVRGQKAKLARA